MAYNKVVYDGQTLIDLTDLDVTASDVKSGITFILADGTKAVGTLVSTSTPTADTIAEWDSSAHMNSTDMTSQEIEDFVDSLNVTGIHAVDYVVEQGTSGIWTYRKWNSGIAECWGYQEGNWSVNTSDGAYGGYRSASISVSTFPTSLFTATPVLVGVASNGYHGGSWLSHVEPSSTGGTFYFAAGTSKTAATRGVNWYAKGTWK